MHRRGIRLSDFKYIHTYNDESTVAFSVGVYNLVSKTYNKKYCKHSQKRSSNFVLSFKNSNKKIPAQNC
jgi:hypothetical protein